MDNNIREKFLSPNVNHYMEIFQPKQRGKVFSYNNQKGGLIQKPSQPKVPLLITEHEVKRVDLVKSSSRSPPPKKAHYNNGEKRQNNKPKKNNNKFVKGKNTTTKRKLKEMDDFTLFS